jgi:putative ABC transport system permease protein
LVTALRHAIRVLVKSPGITTLIEHLRRRMVVGQALRLESIGLGLGLIGALAAARMLDSLLFGVSANDPVTFTGVCATLMLVLMAAACLPACRVTRVDPIVALRD